VESRRRWRRTIPIPSPPTMRTKPRCPSFTWSSVSIAVCLGCVYCEASRTFVPPAAGGPQGEGTWRGNFDSNETPVFQVARGEHFTHAPATEEKFDSILARDHLAHTRRDARPSDRCNLARWRILRWIWHGGLDLHGWQSGPIGARHAGWTFPCDVSSLLTFWIESSARGIAGSRRWFGVAGAWRSQIMRRAASLIDGGCGQTDHGSRLSRAGHCRRSFVR
jgi:hypothetical protein